MVVTWWSTPGCVDRNVRLRVQVNLGKQHPQAEDVETIWEVTKEFNIRLIVSFTMLESTLNSVRRSKADRGVPAIF